MRNAIELVKSFMAIFYCPVFAGLRSKKGQTIVEYALLLVLVAVVVVLMIKTVGLTANNTYSTVNSTITDAIN